MNNLSPLEVIFFAALAKNNPQEREVYLDETCAGDPDLRRRVEKMLAAQNEAGSFLEKPAPALGATGDFAPTPGQAPASVQPRDRVGEVIGPYKLLEPIGEGGMGSVWMAQQTEPVKRLVALKLIKAGMDSKQVIARFEAERQALALRDHPNIAKVFDAGTTGELSDSPGRPYFVMELVKGVSITKYCDEHHLTPRQRLELFIPVCHAIQHAHQKGIIHRDIKPSNVLVAMYDDHPVPKVIDFGVAKATGQQLTEATLHTNFGAVVGTLEYMSPEQASFNQLDVDTRSDIYSLGVLLYELLAGSPPFTKKDLEKAGMMEMLRIIREQEPSKPSTKLSSSETLPSLAANRGTEPTRLTKQVRGELDWIVMKALEKDRSRRYETANGFAQDVQRYLADEAVLACPPSAGYRLRKFARRNKGGLAVAALVLFFLVLLGSGVGWAVRDQAARQSRIGAQVDLVLGEVEQLAKEQKWPEALAVAQRAETLTTGGADGATQERVRQVLNDLQMVARLEELHLREARANEPRATIDEGRSDLYAAAFRDFGVDIEALPAEESTARLRARPAVAIALAAALDDWARVRRPKDREQSKRLWALATALDPDPWRVQVRQASAAMDVAALVKLANAPEMARQPPQSQLLLASSLRLGDQPEQALALLERACESHPGDFWIHFTLALNYTTRPDGTWRLDRVEAGVRHSIAARALRPRSAEAWSLLGNALRHQKKLDEAIACHKRAIELDPKSVSAYNLLGAVLLDQKKLDEAVAAFRKAIELDPKDAKGYVNLGVVLLDQKKLDEAIAVYRKAIELDPKNVQAHNNLGAALYDQKKLDEAIAAFRKAIELDPKDAHAYIGLGNVLHGQKKLDDAIAAFRKAIELDPKNVQVHSTLGTLLYRLNKLDEAVAAFRKAIELDPKNVQAHHNLGAALGMQKKLDEAVAAFRKAIELDPKVAIAHKSLGRVLHDQKKLDEAVACFKKAIELDPKYVQAYNDLGIALREQKKLDEAITCYKKAIELDPKYAGYHNNLGTALHDQKKLDEAIACYKKAIELDPKKAMAYVNLGAALRDQKKLDEAVAAYRKAIELDPKDAAVHNNLGFALGMQKKLDEAIACYKKAIELDPKYALTYSNLGAALRDQKKLDEAVAAYLKAIELDPKDAAVHNNLGFALGMQKKLDEAIACYKKAIELDPKNEWAYRNLAAALRDQGKLDEAIAAFSKVVEINPGTAAGVHAQIKQMSKGKEFDALRAREDFKKLVADVEAKRPLNDRAWELATDPDPSLRDPTRAVELAEKAVAELPKDANCWNTLGVARYRAGDYKGAVAALMKYRELRTNDAEWTNPFFLAMTHWKLDDKDEAARWYKLAVEWMERKKANSEMMRRVRAEAAELLAVEKKKD